MPCRDTFGIAVLDAGDTVVSRAVLLDISGRKVMELVAGENDVRHLAPGVYFVITSHLEPPSQEERGQNPVPAVGRERVAVRKVVVQR